MSAALSYWKKLYTELRGEAVCIDIERMRFNGPIAVIGCREPRDGVVECNHFVRGHNLTAENLTRVFQKYRLLITYNGLRHDIPAIEREFPGVFAKDRRILDLYLLAKKLQLIGGLKTLEATFGIGRLDGVIKKHGAISLWKRYEQQGDSAALQRLLDYNKQDTVNLYPLAEKLMAFIGGETPILLEDWDSLGLLPKTECAHVRIVR